MNTIKHLMMLTLLSGGLALLSGCADTHPLDPLDDVSLTTAFAKGGPPKDGGDKTSTPYVLQWIEPLAQDITVEVDCDYSSGCVLDIPEVGAQLQIGGATLPGPMTISMTALAGTDVNFVFGPHGTQFKKTVKVTVDQDKTDAKTAARDFWALYWVDSLENVQQKLQATLKRGTLEFETDHFSGYALAM